MNLLEIQGLRKAFGGHRVVDGIDITLAPGEMLALIGPNGAGKSTLFNLVHGQLRPDAGSIRLAGREIAGLPPREVFRRGVGRTFQIAQTFGSLTVCENLQLALLSADGQALSPWRRVGERRRDAARALLAQVGIQDQADLPCHTLAYGDLKRVELALAMVGPPRLLLMDEPTAGMAAAERMALMALTRRWASGHGQAVLFTEHSMDVVFGFADRVVVMVAGRVLAIGTPQAMRSDPRVQQAYLGRAGA